MNKQTEAERLANALDCAVKEEDPEDNVIMVARWFVEDSAAELRRLSAINAELVEALEMFERAASHTGHAHEILSVDSVVRQVMRLALEKAKQ